MPPKNIGINCQLYIFINGVGIYFDLLMLQEKTQINFVLCHHHAIIFTQTFSRSALFMFEILYQILWSHHPPKKYLGPNITMQFDLVSFL